MTDRVSPTTNATASSTTVALAIANSGGLQGGGWVVPIGATHYADQHPDLNGGPFNAAQQVSLSSGTLTVDTVEAYVAGRWLARDTQTTVDVSGFTGTVDLGWDRDASNTVILDRSDSTAWGADDGRITLFEVDGGTVTDARTVGFSAAFSQLDVEDVIASDDVDVGDLLTLGGVAAPSGPAVPNEVARAGGTKGDVAVVVEAADGAFAIVKNAYYDNGEWYRLAEGEAYGVFFKNDATEFRVASSNTSDTAIAWQTFQFDLSGDIRADGTTLFDGDTDTVPKAALGGPASSLQNHPLQKSDVVSGTHTNGIDARTLRGAAPSELTGRFTEVYKHTESYAGDRFVFDSQEPTGIDLTPYDYIRLIIQMENTQPGTFGDTETYLYMRLNGVGASVYEYDYFDAYNNTFTSADGHNKFGRIGGAYPSHFAVQTIEVALPDFHASSTFSSYPMVNIVNPGVAKNIDHIGSGTMQRDVTDINRIEVYSNTDGITGSVTVYGATL